MDEKQLVAAAQAGDFSAFSQLVSKYERQVFNLAKRMAPTAEDAEDILQETMLKAIDKIDQFRGDSSFGTWLYSIALNIGRGFLKSEKRADLQPIEDYLPSHAEGPDRRLHEWKDPHQVLEQAQLKRVLEDAIDELRAEYSVPFILRYIEELPVKEVARIMDLSEAATKSRILRARLFLRDKLEPLFQVEDDDEKVRRISKRS
jgi:RNA polymerase sigma-70 factor (ECF subfamily)